MAGPRRGLAALLVQLTAEPRRTVLVVEGESDRDAIKLWARHRDLPIDVYHINDFYLETFEQYKIYGGNKGRIITAIHTIGSIDPMPRNLQGIVDRDLDSVLDRVINLAGLVYTDNASLFCHVATVLDIDYIFEVNFRRNISEVFCRKAIDFSKKFFILRCALSSLLRNPALVSLNKYILDDFEFDWERYELVIAQRNSIDFDVLRDGIQSITAIDVWLDYHYLVLFVWLAAKKSSILQKGVTLEEMYRAFFHRYVLKVDSCPTLQRLRLTEA